MSLKQKVKKKIEEIEDIKCFIHYVFDVDKWESRLFPSKEIKPIFESKSFKEIYYLDKVCYYLDGKPVFLVVRGVPYSLEFAKLQENLTIKGYSASEIEAKINSIYVNSVFRKSAFTFREYLSWLLSLLVCGLSVYILTYFSVSAQYQQNQTIPTNSTVVGGG